MTLVMTTKVKFEISIVANSLLLSSVWHMLYVTPAPLSFFAAIRTHIRSFLRLGFGSPGWPLLCLPRKSGGLGLIDPDHQQRALQLRWILPILHSHSFSSTSFILPYLKFIHPLNFRAPSASIALLFPCSSATCPTSLLPLHRACTSLLPASLPSNLQLPPTVVQHFPLTSIWMNVPPFVDSSLNLKTILVSEAFSLETDDRLVRKVRGTFSRARNRIGHFFQQIDSGRMVLCPWFISCLEHRPSTDTPSPDLSSLLSLVRLDNTSLGKASTGSLRRHLRPQCKFWSVSIPHHCRTVWWKMLWDRTPTRKRLNLFIPRRFPSSSCIFCQDATEDQYHFFFGCSIKCQVWNVILSRFCPAWNLAEICLLLTRGSFPPRSSHQGLWILLSAVTAKAIWSAHWKFVFDDQPFLSGVVAQKASTVIEKHIGTLA
ncbi:hypothetical protein PHYBLDRAFT_168632 [Phycomyces blakesleeanus NRRL 1555(-)]|uniref:Reverse transcriptase zinc-binding domain-containing protein n=1 Tax=Phycomyces blakesleeanus (strain ATCC 8743b / DSM 1359 / FGSC 10004 / NBRC 33097 / NRRL 1555) TaxID=763407 RepID=A0A162NDB7_PHYB8|nr:hypothetical protein PHYBLDRAFT_168632 [Phycomyces blakesleeanus NRRL 1555(-)]OAD73278.1 hypothetical protein PHYBLDRAFT_168632 [Phycomyces blakesleeanus NRRL 1555(-)]|eukprot:XP_018291318.1 hypothetical protein PHYBLDRAFT_168632 [Phycomyces blakesleeanus NRRL 1555(-)]